MNKQLGLLVVTLGIGACKAPPPTDVGSVSQANFVNGDFEGGNLNSWTASSALWGNGGGNVGFANFPPRTFADLKLTGSGTLLTSIVTAGIPAELTAPDSLRLPFYGVDSAKVNSPIAGVGNHNSNYLQQSMTTTVADVDVTDGKIHVRFAAAPILDFPTPAHNPDQQPYFFIEVRNTTKNVALYNTFNFSNQPGVTWKPAAVNVGGSPVLYTDWEAFDLAPGPSGIAVGDTVQATVVATGCSYNAHFGEVYVDEFGTTFPYPNVDVSAPTFVNANTDLTYTVTAKNNASGSATGVIVDFTTPPVADSNLAGVPNTVETTYVSASAPGVSCNSPTAGSTKQTLTCNLGDLAPGASYTFTVTVHVPTVPGTFSAPVFVNEGLYDIKTDQRPTPLGGGLVQTQVTNTPLVGLQTTLTDGVPSVIWGQTDVYTLTVTNNGPNASNAVVITDARPAQLSSPTWTCVATGGATCTASGSGALNTTAKIPVGGKVTYTITTTVTGGPAAGSFTYTATATPPATQAQSTAFNNIGTDADTVSTSLFVLTVAKSGAGNGSGTIESVPSGIVCGATCTQSYASGTQVALTALPDVGSVFTGWSGACAGTANPCTVTIAAATSVTARFDKPVLTTALTTTSNAGLTNVRPGDTADYSVKLAIPAGATGAPIIATDTFPAGLAFSSATTPTVTGALTCSVGSCTAPTVVTGTTSTWDFGEVTCTSAGPCEIDFTITARVANTTTRGTTLVDSIGATLMGTQAQTTLTVIEPNLTVDRTFSPSTGLVRGQPDTVTVTLADNTGGANSDAFDVVVTLPIPAGYTGSTYAAGTCPAAAATFTGGNATFTFPTGAAGAIATGTSCTFTYQLTGGAAVTGNATVPVAAGSAAYRSITGAAPPAKLYSAFPPAGSFMTAPIPNGGTCAAAGECASDICDATDHQCGIPDGGGPCASASACRSGDCSANGNCAPSGGCLVDADCDTGTQFCDTTTEMCVSKLPNGAPLPGGSGPCTPAVALADCASGVCDPSNDACGLGDGDGPCSGAAVCRSGYCSTTGVCAAAGSCLADADCNTASQFCDTDTHACVDKLPNGSPIPTIGNHTPALTGQCTSGEAMVVCVSAVCDATSNTCGYANGSGSCDPATAATVCQSGVCGSDGMCGQPNGTGPCTVSTGAIVCRGGACLPSGTCGTSCTADSDCDAQSFCNTDAKACQPKLGNGTPIPSISGHVPALSGVCTSDAATSVCASGVCDPSDNLCGYADGQGSCTPTSGASVCRSGVCGTNSTCATPGTTFAFTGGGFSCAMGGAGGGPGATLCGILLLLVGMVRARGRRALLGRG